MRQSERHLYRFISTYSDGERVYEGQVRTDDPEAKVAALLAFREDQDQGPVRIDYERVL